RRLVRIVRPFVLGGCPVRAADILPVARPWPPGRAPTGSQLVPVKRLFAGGLRPRPRPSVQGNEEPFSGAVAASGAVTQTLSGERPAGLRTTRAELFEAKTAPAVRQGLV